MKKQLTTLLTFSLLASLAACSKSASTGITKSNDSADVFQAKSISRVGLNMKLALTFDDGPTTGTTDALLDVLADEGIKASFFLNGRHVRGRERTVLRMNKDGHVVANHGHTHAHLVTTATKKGMRELFNEVNDSHLAIQPYLQREGRLYFRAPFGAWKSSFAPFLNQDQVLRDYIGPVFWDIGGAISIGNDGSVKSAADWDCWKKLNVARCAQGYMNESLRMRGGIVLMHDVDMKTVEMVRLLIPKWRKAGFKFVTLDQLPQLDKYAR